VTATGRWRYPGDWPADLVALGILTIYGTTIRTPLYGGFGRAMIVSALLEPFACLIGALCQAAIAKLVLAAGDWAVASWSLGQSWALPFSYYTFILLSWSLAHLWAAAQLETAKARQRAMAAETEALRNELQHLRHQLDPHFLFNALNGIAAEIPVHPDRAGGMVRELADFLRYSLDHRDLKPVTLAAEVEAIRAYLELQKARFGEDFDFRIAAAPDALARSTPGFLLQPLVENAIKHGLKSGRRPLIVEVAIAPVGDDIVMRVANPGGLRPDLAKQRRAGRRAGRAATPNGAALPRPPCLLARPGGGAGRGRARAFGCAMPDVILVDDEPLAREGLRTLLAAHPDVRIVGEAASVAQARALIATARPDVVFLDIEMADATGLDLVRTLERPPAIIFVTAHAAHAVEAFAVQATDYLLKPVRPERLAAALARLPAVPDARDRFGAAGSTVLRVRSRQRVLSLRPAALVALLAERDYTRIIPAHAMPLLVKQPLGELYKALPHPPFLKLGRSLIVNGQRLTEVQHIERGETRLFFDGHAGPIVLGRTATSIFRKSQLAALKT